MKELSIEQKARAYDEALAKAKEQYNYPCMRSCMGILEEIFPELKEESEDEKTRKDIKQHFLYLDDSFPDKAKWLAWLEKQDGQKPILDFKAKDWYVSKVDGKIHNIYHSVDRVEPKFKVGDFIANDYCRGKIIKITDDAYLLDTGQGIPFSCEHNVHLWTIQDAEGGDVLICKGNIKNSNGIKYERICLFNNLDNAFFTLTKTSNFVEEYGIDVNIDYPDNTVPATKEQKEILFMAMKAAGYEFDFEKKELKKIEQKPAEKTKPQSSTPMSYGKELEKRMCEACNRFFAPNTDSNRYSASDLFYARVKAERDLNTLAWSEEDERIYRGLHNLIYSTPYCDSRKELSDFLDSLKNRVQPQQEWSEDDEDYINDLIKYFSQNERLKNTKEDIVNWLKSLRPQNTWKPSDEQIKAIRLARAFVTDDFSENPTLSDVLVELEEQLKKLKEE